MQTSLFRFAFGVLIRSRFCGFCAGLGRSYSLHSSSKTCLQFLSVSGSTIMNRGNSKKPSPPVSTDSNKDQETGQSRPSKHDPATRATLIDDELHHEVKEAKKKYTEMTLQEKRKLYRYDSEYIPLENIPTWPDFADQLEEKYSKPRPKSNTDESYKVNENINKKISLISGDITSLEIDAIVNAANSSLMGGGGVDGAIHDAAGRELKKECRLLNGCVMGDAKITCGYKLPAKYIIHTVGPIGENAKALCSAYHRCLELVEENNLKSVAFPCISTGIYGYPVASATHVALKTIRDWLEKENKADKVDRVILCVFLKKDFEVYKKLLQVYFPLSWTAAADGETDGKNVEKPNSKSSPKKGKDSNDESLGEIDSTLGPKKCSDASDAKTLKRDNTASGAYAEGEAACAAEASAHTVETTSGVAMETESASSDKVVAMETESDGEDPEKKPRVVQEVFDKPPEQKVAPKSLQQKGGSSYSPQEGKEKSPRKGSESKTYNKGNTKQQDEKNREDKEKKSAKRSSAINKKEN